MKNSFSSSTRLFGFLYILILACSPTLASTTIELKSGETLSGQLLSFDSSDSILLKHPSSVNSLNLKSDAIKAITTSFQANNDKKFTPQQASIHLISGERFAGAVSKITKNEIQFFFSNFNKNYSIKKDSVHKIQFGSSTNYTLYDQANGSPLFTNIKGWKNEKNIYQINSPGEIWNKFPLPADFILEFTIASSRVPDLDIYFGADSPSLNHHQATYHLAIKKTKNLLFSQKNVSSTGRINILKASPKIINSIKNLNPIAHFKLLVSRSTGNIHLYINGQLKQSLFFPLSSDGNYIGFSSTNKFLNTQQTLTDIKIQAWNGITHSQITEYPQDTVFNYKNGDIHTGKKVESLTKNDVILYRLKPDSSTTKPIEASAETLSSIYLNPIKKANNSEKKILIHLKNHQVFECENIKLKNNVLFCIHPIIGEIKIAFNQVSSLKLITPKPNE